MFDGLWTLVKSTDLDDTFNCSEVVWTGTFMECMTIAKYEELDTLKINHNLKSIVALFYPLDFTTGGDI